MISLSSGSKGANVREVAPDFYIAQLADNLKRNQLVKPPEWAELAKTGALKQMPPNYIDWWYVRVASIARQVYLHPGTSVESLRNKFGGSNHTACAPKHHFRCSGKIIRVCLQQLQKVGWIQTSSTGGRVITPKGQKQLDTVAQEISKLQK